MLFHCKKSKIEPRAPLSASIVPRQCILQKGAAGDVTQETVTISILSCDVRGKGQSKVMKDFRGFGFDLLEKSLMLAVVEGKRGRGRLNTRWLYNIVGAMSTNIDELRDAVEDRKRCRIKSHNVSQSRRRLND